MRLGQCPLLSAFVILQAWQVPIQYMDCYCLLWKTVTCILSRYNPFRALTSSILEPKEKPYDELSMACLRYIHLLWISFKFLAFVEVRQRGKKELQSRMRIIRFEVVLFETMINILRILEVRIKNGMWLFILDMYLYISIH